MKIYDSIFDKSLEESYKIADLEQKKNDINMKKNETRRKL